MKIEYKKINTDQLELGIERLNTLGSEGWDLVEIVNKNNNKYTYYFKRYI